MTVSELSRYFN